jgi:hypothetical protein
MHKSRRGARQDIVTRVEAGEMQGVIAATLGVTREMVKKPVSPLSKAPKPDQAAPDRSSRARRSPK